MSAPIGQRWHTIDLAILAACIGAALVLLLVIRHETHRDTRIPVQPVACVQVPSNDGRGLPGCARPALFNPSATLDDSRIHQGGGAA